VPCEPNGPEQVGRATLLFEPDGRGGVRARVLGGNDEPDLPTGTLLPASLPADGVLVLGAGEREFGVCRDGASDDRCGA
jgi:hypothetical protein